MIKPPCMQCPVVCICASKFKLKYVYTSFTVLYRECSILYKWIDDQSLNWKNGRYKIIIYFKTLKESNYE